MRQVFETFLGSYWVHGNQYTPKKGKQRKNIVNDCYSPFMITMCFNLTLLHQGSKLSGKQSQTENRSKNGKKGFPPTPKLWYNVKRYGVEVEDCAANLWDLFGIILGSWKPVKQSSSSSSVVGTITDMVECSINYTVFNYCQLMKLIEKHFAYFRPDIVTVK